MRSKLMNIAGRRARTLPLVLAAATAAMAGGNASAEEWKWSATPYVWATDVGIDVEIAGRELVDAAIPFEDLVETLDSAALLRVEGMYGEHGMAFDLFNVELADTHAIELPGEANANVALDAAIRLTILDAAGVYDAGADGEGLSLIYGVRTIEQRNDIELALNRDGTTIATRSLDATDTLVDGLIGFRYAHELPYNLSYRLAVDASTGDTEYTWSAGAAIGYTFGDDDRYEVTAGYRHMVIDYDTAEPVDSDMSMSGLLVGFRINF